MTVPLQLWNVPHWELMGRCDDALFFEQLLAALPSATTLFVEGTSIARDVENFLRSVAEPGDYLPMRQTLWPRPKQYRIPCDGRILAALAELAERHAAPELVDHLFVYDGSPKVLLEFPDAFAAGSCAFVSADVSEAHVRAFAAVLGLELTDVRQKDRR